MKLVMAVIHDEDVKKLLSSLTKHGFQATKLASTGGFLKFGNSTILVGVDEEKNTVIRFGNEGVSFLVAFEGDANSVSYELSPVSKEPVNFDGVFYVETSVNGKDWKAIHTFNKRNNFDVSDKYTHPIESDVRYIKWTYSKRNKLNVNLNNIEVVPVVL